MRVGRAGVILVALAAIAFIVWRVVNGTPPRRRALVVGAPVAVAFLLSQAAYQTARLLEIEGDTFYSVAQWTLVGTRASIWYGFLVALIAAELFAGRVLRRVVIESLRRPALGELEAMLRGPLGDPGLRLAFRRPDGDGWVDADGEPLADPAPGCVLTEVERDGQAAAAIVHDAQLAEEPELLRAAGAVALLAQENAQLETAWNDSLRELQDSRRRIVAASEGERRRLERDLHDGAQQRLVSLRIGLAIASEQAAADPVTSARLGEFERDVDGAIEELRELAHGIFPSVLADRGLVPALRAIGRSGPRHVEVTGRRIGRYPPEIESAVYYCCLEALQNATKHAGPAAHIAAHLSAKDGELRLEVSDDGPGFDVDGDPRRRRPAQHGGPPRRGPGAARDRLVTRQRDADLGRRAGQRRRPLTPRLPPARWSSRAVSPCSVDRQPASSAWTAAAPRIGSGGRREPRRIQDEGLGLRAAEPAVEADQLLERAALVQDRVVEAPDHEVGDVREAARAQQVGRRRGRERGQRVLPHDPVGLEVALARRAPAPRRRARPSARAASRCAGGRAAPGSARGGARRSPRA